MDESVIFHVPHSSVTVPADVNDQYVLNSEDLNNELSQMTDHLTLELVSSGFPSATIVDSKVSRLVVDVERFSDDEMESMSAKGMGAVYTQTHDGKPLRRALSGDERQRLLEAWYYPHHLRLEQAVTDAIEAKGYAVVIDVHSYPSVCLPYEENQQGERPEVCIGTDAFHTPKHLANAVVGAFRAKGFWVGLDTPFAGALVPMSRYRSDSRVFAFMIEIRRDQYLDEKTFKASSQFSAFCKSFEDSVRQALDTFAERHSQGVQ